MLPIGRLRGLLIERHPPSLLIEVGGVGYELDASMMTHQQLPPLGEEVVLYTHGVIRDDAHLLYGFISHDERTLFRELLKVTGIGGKLALLILSSFTPAAVEQAIQTADSATLMRVPGVGKRLAERLVIELRDRLPQLGLHAAPAVTTAPSTAALVNSPTEEAIQALVALGYRLPDATKLVGSIASAELSRDDLIRQALRAALRG